MEDGVKQLLAKTIQLADQVNKEANKKGIILWFKRECSQLKSVTEVLVRILHQDNYLPVARINSHVLYDRPKRLIIGEAQHVLIKTLALLRKCRGATGLMNRLIRAVPTANALVMIRHKVACSINNFKWLLFDYEGPPLIIRNEPILGMIWETITKLLQGPPLRSVTEDNLFTLILNKKRYRRLFVQEGGVRPLLKLMEEDNRQGDQQKAARAITILGSDPENVDHIISVGACSVFAKILTEGVMIMQEEVACGVSCMAKANPKCQHHFAQHGIVRLLVTCLLHTEHDRMQRVAAKALWRLATGNLSICRSIVDLKALSGFATLIERGSLDAKYCAAMAVMEIAEAAGKDAYLKRSVTEQVLMIIENEERRDLLIHSITGNLVRTLGARELRITDPFARLLDGREATISISKFVREV